MEQDNQSSAPGMSLAWDVWARASRMLDDLRAHGMHLEDATAFRDRLPYVLDLLAGVRRVINEHRPQTDAFRAWWATQRTPARDAVNAMRNAELKAYQQRAAPAAFAHTNASAGSYNGQPVNSGDTFVVFLGWRFAGGHFDGHEVIQVLQEQLKDLRGLIQEAETRLTITDDNRSRSRK